MMTTRRKWITRSLATAVLAASCLAAIPASSGTAASASTVHWQPCGTIGALCARLSVPLDWSHPDGAKISLALSELPAADPSERLGNVVFNPGGPGAPGAALIENEGNVLPLPQQVRDRFDVIGFDPRGVGASTPAITCTQPVFDPAVTEFPATQAQYDQLVAHNRAVGENCLKNTGPLLAHVDTVSVARDVNAIRIALGENKLNFFGLSYGSLIGNIYARLYPQHIRAMVLDGPIDHAVGSARLASDENAASEVALQHFFTWCDQQASCALHTEGARATYTRLEQMQAKGPLQAKSIAGGVDAEVAIQGVYQDLTLTPEWPELATALQQAVAGDASALVEGASNGPDSSAVYSLQDYVSIGCQDFPSSITSFAQLHAQITQAQQVAPDFNGHEEGWLLEAGCIGWPLPAQDSWQPEPVRGAPPILIVAGKYDPSTTYAWGVGLARQIQGSILLTRWTDGHTGDEADPCAQQREADYFVNPRAPVGTTCQ